ncbi:MAG: UMP kinase [Rickettsiales bacterium]|jgi:uridylate kinase|nr:UMP kinase [Rickettsiales bacterium]
MNFRRILFKISGESLMGAKSFGYDAEAIGRVAKEISHLHKSGVQICAVVGGGNVFRGVSNSENLIDRTNADCMGMLATIMNGIALQSFLLRFNIPTEIQSALRVEKICEAYNRKEALEYIEGGKVVLFVAGTGNPFFTTDTAAILRASEMHCDVVLKGTQVNGVYSEDPKKFPNARRYKTITFDEVLRKNIRIMDQTAFALAKSNSIPIVIFRFRDGDSIMDLLKDRNNYTLVSSDVAVEEFDE